MPSTGLVALKVLPLLICEVRIMPILHKGTSGALRLRVEVYNRKKNMLQFFNKPNFESRFSLSYLGQMTQLLRTLVSLSLIINNK